MEDIEFICGVNYTSALWIKNSWKGRIYRGNNLWNICENLATCVWSFACHQDPGLVKGANGRASELPGEILYTPVMFLRPVFPNLACCPHPSCCNGGFSAVSACSFIHRVWGKREELFFITTWCMIFLTEVLCLDAMSMPAWIKLWCVFILENSNRNYCWQCLCSMRAGPPANQVISE